MSESFAELFERSLNEINMEPGAIVPAIVVDIDGDWITVNAGLKSEGQIPAAQFKDDNGQLTVKIGDHVSVALEAVEDGFGETRLSREKAKRAEAWKDLEFAFEKNQLVRGTINGKVKGGFTVDVNSIRAFLPGSLVDVRPVRDTNHLENKELDFRVIKLDAKRNNVVVSRRAVLEAENSAERDALLSTLQEGQQVKGIVKNLTDYGAFVDLGGVDGLLHITDMAWKRIKHPSEVVAVGDEINVKVLKFDRDRNRVSLGLKQLGEDPWISIKARYPVGAKVRARITNLTDYGCFAEIEEGVEGLVHVSEMDWTNKNIHPSKVVQVGEEVDVMILDIDEERRRISLGIKQCTPNPWEEFNKNHNKGDHIKGMIKSITDFGVFIGLDSGIDGLVHLSDLSWSENGEEAVRHYRKGEEVEAIILSIDPERERISLGVKQLENDPLIDYLTTHDKGSIVLGRVAEVNAKEAQIELIPGVIANIKAQEFSDGQTDDLQKLIKVGDELEAKIVNVDRKNRLISLSVRAKDQAETRRAISKMREEESDNNGPTTIGDLIKQKLNQE